MRLDTLPSMKEAAANRTTDRVEGFGQDPPGSAGSHGVTRGSALFSLRLALIDPRDIAATLPTLAVYEEPGETWTAAEEPNGTTTVPQASLHAACACKLLTNWY